MENVIEGSFTSVCNGQDCTDSMDGMQSILITKQLIYPYFILAHQYFGMTTFYPSIRFTFGLPELAPDDEVVIFSIRIKQNVSCRLIIEDKLK